MPFNVGPLEIVVVLIIALIVFGPKRLPELGNSLGQGIREFRDSISAEHKAGDEAREIEEAPSPAKAEAPEPVEGEEATEKRG
jgi:sec-independent protein translocase protein TatA